MNFPSLAAFTIALLSVPLPASAHLAEIGLGPIYDGLAHPFVTPTALLPLLALSLIAALAGRAHGRVLLSLAPAAWLIGSLGGLLLTREPEGGLVVAALTCGLGLLGAADVRVPLNVLAVIAGAAGLMLGVLDGAAVSAAGRGALPVLGITATVAGIITVVAGHGTSVRAGAARIALRVGGSWIAAISLLSVGWSLRATPGSF